MDPFVRRLIQRLSEPSQPLTRNRHFHTFDNPEGRYALQLLRRLKALQKRILEGVETGRGSSVAFREDDSPRRVELKVPCLNGHHIARLDDDELALLMELPGVRAALEPAPASH